MTSDRDEWHKSEILYYAGVVSAPAAVRGVCGLSPCDGRCPRECQTLSPAAFHLMLVVCGRTCPGRRDYPERVVARDFPHYRGRYSEFIKARCIIWGRFHVLRDVCTLSDAEFLKAYEELKTGGYVEDKAHSFGGIPGTLVRQTLKGYDTFTNFYRCWRAAGGDCENRIFDMR